MTQIRQQEANVPGARAARRQTFFVVVFLVVVLLFVTLFRLALVRGVSMEPTFHNGQTVLVWRLNRFLPPLKRNDVIVLQQGRDVIIKRIYRLPGEEIDDSFPFVLRASRVNNVLDYYEQENSVTPDGIETHYRVPAGYLVVLGDNLRQSEDSRIFGPVPVRDVLGVVARAPGPPYSGPPPGFNGELPGRLERRPSAPVPNASQRPSTKMKLAANARAQ